MLSAGFLPPLTSSLWGEAGSPCSTTTGSSALTRQIRNASTAFVAAAGISSDVSTLPIDKYSITAADSSTLVTAIACSPPRSYTKTSNFTRHLTVPTAALASSKTRKKRRGGGGGNGDEGGNDDFGGDDGFFGGSGDDDGGNFGGNNGDEGNDGSPFDDSMGRWVTDVVLLWTVFCAWSTWNCIQHVTKTKQPATSPCLAACVSYSTVTATTFTAP
ncbi:hypothetical protein NADE_001661 [Nannochloris sp. 'desiccata']|nr:hypothetical protein KSW81_001482 [Chlorella desiccata (nom. nud.)]KAH7616854.1 hypothetical protein NADE_001661 [Chlorella desiccata (nom. nud.)]